MEWIFFISNLHYPHLSQKHFFPEGSLLTYTHFVCVTHSPCLIRFPVWAYLEGYYWSMDNLLVAIPLKKVPIESQGVVGPHKLLPIPWWDADWPNLVHDLWSKHSYGEPMCVSLVLPSVSLEHISPSSNSYILFIFLWALEAWYIYYFLHGSWGWNLLHAYMVNALWTGMVSSVPGLLSYI